MCVSASDKWNFKEDEKRRFISNGNTQLFLLQRRGAIIICFRGTKFESYWDWRTNADVPLVTDKVLGGGYGSVHEGFSKATDDVWDELFTTTREWMAADVSAKFWITGHSLGGALAELTAARLVEKLGHDSLGGLYTFGKPNVGDNTYKESFSSRIGNHCFWFVNDQDIVPRVPPVQWGYAQTGNLCHITASETIDTVNCNISELPGTVIAELKLIKALLESRPLAAVADLLDPVLPVVGLLGDKLPPELLGQVRDLLPPRFADHFSRGYLDALSAGMKGP
jgi:hypothetical protein